jgi:hypothetical protein
VVTAKRFAVLVIRYEQKNEKDVERSVAEVTEHIKAQGGEARSVYEGSDDRIISALEKVLNLTK